MIMIEKSLPWWWEKVILILNLPLQALLIARWMSLLLDSGDAIIVGMIVLVRQAKVLGAVYHRKGTLGSSRTDRIALTRYSQTSLAETGISNPVGETIVYSLCLPYGPYHAARRQAWRGNNGSS